MLELALGVLDAAVLELAPSALDAVSISSSAVLELARGVLDTDCRFPHLFILQTRSVKFLPSISPFNASSICLRLQCFPLHLPLPVFPCGQCGVHIK